MSIINLIITDCLDLGKFRFEERWFLDVQSCIALAGPALGRGSGDPPSTALRGRLVVGGKGSTPGRGKS